MPPLDYTWEMVFIRPATHQLIVPHLAKIKIAYQELKLQLLTRGRLVMNELSPEKRI